MSKKIIVLTAVLLFALCVIVGLNWFIGMDTNDSSGKETTSALNESIEGTRSDLGSLDNETNNIKQSSTETSDVVDKNSKNKSSNSVNTSSADGRITVSATESAVQNFSKKTTDTKREETTKVITKQKFSNPQKPKSSVTEQLKTTVSQSDKSKQTETKIQKTSKTAGDTLPSDKSKEPTTMFEMPTDEYELPFIPAD